MSDVNRGVSAERWLGTERSHIYIKVYDSRRININLVERCSILLQPLSLSLSRTAQINKICHMPLNKHHTQMQIMSCKFHKLHRFIACFHVAYSAVTTWVVTGGCTFITVLELFLVK